MNVFFVSSEAVPFAKTGGLADVVSSLACALEKLGHSVKVIIPRYKSINTQNLEQVCSLQIRASWGSENCTVYKTILPESQAVEIYFLDSPGCFGNREGLYGSKTESDYSDNTYRFTLLSRSVFELCKTLDYHPDIIHCHDWSSALASVFLKCEYSFDYFKSTASVLTIHNLGYQGIYPSAKYTDFALDTGLYYSCGFESSGRLNILKAGITTANELTTVSPTYASEIQTFDYGFGLDSLLWRRKDHLTGILNGADLSLWNPEEDELIPFNYSCDSLSGKKKCKAELQKQFGLPPEQNVPVVGIVMRLAEQKGIHELFGASGAMDMMCRNLKAQFVIVGSGETWCENAIKNLCAKYENVRAFIGYSEKTSHLVEAGADLFLLPSRYEPCGLNQIYSLVYGTLPVVHRTGGLADTVINFNEYEDSGNGFTFDMLSPDSIFNTVKWAVDVYTNKRPLFDRIQQRAMKCRFDWSLSAQQYVEVYNKALKQL